MSGGAMRKMAVYLGLVEEQERYDQYGQYGEYQDGDEYAEEPAAAAPTPREPVPAGASVSTLAERRVAAPAVAPAPQRAELSKITTLNPRTYNEARTIGEHFRDGTPVIMNLTEMDGDDAKRLVDFSAGLVFGLRGSIERVSAKVFLLSPVNVTVAAEDKARMAENGFFNQS